MHMTYVYMHVANTTGTSSGTVEYPQGRAWQVKGVVLVYTDFKQSWNEQLNKCVAS